MDLPTSDSMLDPRTNAILVPNLCGNGADGPALRSIADDKLLAAVS